MPTKITNVQLVGSELGVSDVVFDDSIIAIRPAGAAPDTEADVVIEGNGQFLAPGLIDAHVHLGSRDALMRAASAGITTVVDLGTHPDDLIDRYRSASDLPGVLSAGSAASAPGSTQIAAMGFPAESGVNDPDDAERFLDWRKNNGSQLIKIIIEDASTTQVPALDVETISALVDGAHRRGLLTVAHVVTAAAFDRGLDAGVDILTHAPMDRPLSDATLQRMLDTGTIASPTLVMMRTMAYARLGERAEAAFNTALESVRLMHEAGVSIIAGTDANESSMAPVPHGQSLHDEIELLQQAGLSVAEVVHAATSNAAAALRLTDRGQLAEGLRADLILLDSDPLVDPSALRNPAAVWAHGRRIG